MSNYTTGLGCSQTLLFIFLHLVCKSLSVNDLRARGQPRRRNSFRLSDLQKVACQLTKGYQADGNNCCDYDDTGYYFTHLRVQLKILKLI